MRRSFFTPLCTAALAAGLIAMPADASVVNFDFGEARQYDGTGVAPGSGTYWNNMPAGEPDGPFTVTSGAALESDGVTASNISLEVSSDITYVAGGLGDNGLLEDWFITKEERAFTLSGLDPNLAYDLYLYGINGRWNSRSTLFTINGVSQETINESASWDEYEEGSSHVIFTNVAPTAEGVIEGTYAAGSFTSEGSSNNDGSFNGMQVVAVPEPASMALIGAGAMLLALRRRRSV